MSKVAIIDMGTNTFHLLIAEGKEDGDWSLIHKEKVPVLLGKGNLAAGLLSEAAMDRGMAALQSFRKRIDREQITHIRAVATSAVRSTSNGATWLKEVEAKTGIKVDLISGDKEAELIWLGVKQSLPLSERSLIMDIGGGSTEFIIADEDQVFWKQSYQLGVSRLLDRFAPSDPMSNTETETIRQHVEDTLKSLREALVSYPCSWLVGSSGSFDSLRDMMIGANQLKADPNKFAQELREEDYQVWSELLKSKTETERRAIDGLIPLRAAMIHISCVCIDEVLTYQPFRKIIQTDYALKEGLILSAL